MTTANVLWISNSRGQHYVGWELEGFIPPCTRYGLPNRLFRYHTLILSVRRTKGRS